MTQGWSAADATAFLQSREMFGLRPGLERMNALLSELGNPQLAFKTIHVVGTNGKSSTTRFAAALLCEMGVPAGAYVSPHLIDFNERVLLPGSEGLREADPAELANALMEVAGAAEQVEAKRLDGELITQFELMTAAAFVLFAGSGAEAAVVEAGLGGRLDATNVLSEDGVCVLTSVGIDHAQWLGDDQLTIAQEKLAVVGARGALVVGNNLEPAVRELAGALCEQSARKLVEAQTERTKQVEMKAKGSFQRTNLALAIHAVEELTKETLSPQTIDRVAASTVVPGRMQRIGDEPLTIIDAAHNPDGIAALMGEMKAHKGRGQLWCVFGVLADKDVPGMLDAMLPYVDQLIVTAPQTPRTLCADELEAIAAASGFANRSIAATAQDGVAWARAHAKSEDLVLATGSVHIAGELLAGDRVRVVSGL